MKKHHGMKMEHPMKKMEKSKHHTSGDMGKGKESSHMAKSKKNATSGHMGKGRRGK